MLLVALQANAVTLGVSSDGRYFTLNGKPTFLLGISYYAGTSVEKQDDLERDLDDMVACGFNWIRVWAFWDLEENVAVLTPDGQIREPYMSRLKKMITECNERRMIVDVTMHRGGPHAPSDQAGHLACAKVLATELRRYRNVYIDVGNERDVGDARFVSYDDVGALIGAIKAIDPKRLCTASGVPSSESDLNKYLSTGRCDFIATHLCRDASCPAETGKTVGTFISWMKTLGRRVPVHLQEPFRRDYGSWQPTEEDYYRDATGAKMGEGAGWCLHNGATRGDPPFRSFCMNNKHGRLFSQLDPVELSVARGVKDRIGVLNR